MIKSKVNMVIKIFLIDSGILKSILNCAAAAKRIKENSLSELDLFAEIPKNEKQTRDDFISLVIKMINDWKDLLGKDHKGKVTSFLMIHRALYSPEEVDLNFESTNLNEIFTPTEKDPLVSKYIQFSVEYEVLNDKLSNTQQTGKPAFTSLTEQSIVSLVQRGHELYKKLAEFESSFCLMREVSQIYLNTKKYIEFMIQELNSKLKDINPVLVQDFQEPSRNVSMRGSLS
jgi:hypothetical protein